MLMYARSLPHDATLAAPHDRYAGMQLETDILALDNPTTALLVITQHQRLASVYLLSLSVYLFRCFEDPPSSSR